MIGIDPRQPIPVRPGAAKVPYLRARYDAGLPLWHDGDFCGDDDPRPMVDEFRPLEVDDGCDLD